MFDDEVDVPVRQNLNYVEVKHEMLSKREILFKLEM
jgi:hypothetical protein